MCVTIYGVFAYARAIPIYKPTTVSERKYALLHGPTATFDPDGGREPTNSLSLSLAFLRLFCFAHAHPHSLSASYTRNVQALGP